MPSMDEAVAALIVSYKKKKKKKPPSQRAVKNSHESSNIFSFSIFFRKCTITNWASPIICECRSRRATSNKRDHPARRRGSFSPTPVSNTGIPQWYTTRYYCRTKRFVLSVDIASVDAHKHNVLWGSSGASFIVAVTFTKTTSRTKSTGGCIPRRCHYNYISH